MPRLAASPPLRERHGFVFEGLLELELDGEGVRDGPLKGLRFLFAKMSPGEGGGAVPKAAVLSLRVGIVVGEAPERTRRMFDGKVEDVGVAGRTLILPCGDLVLWCPPPTVETLGEAMEADDVEDALLWLWWWCGMLLILDIDEEVDFLPRRPPEERR